MDNVHVGDVAKYSFFDQVTLQAKVKEDSAAVSWLESMMVRFPMWMKGHAVGTDPAAAFIGGNLYQIKGDSHSYVQTWRVHGGQLKQAKRAQWSGVAGYLPITDAAVVAEVEGAMERWKLLLAGKVGGKRDTGTGGDEEGYDTDQSRHGSCMSRAKKPKLGTKEGPVVTQRPPISPSGPLREHLKDTQAQLKARIVELEKVRKESATAQKAAEDMLREERVKWEDERREKDNEIRKLRVKLQDASVRGSKKGPSSPALGRGGKMWKIRRIFCSWQQWKSGMALSKPWFTWTAVQVNHGISPSSTMPGHKHQDHLPLSAIVTVGDFSGGEFCVEEAGLVFPTKGARPYTMACVAGPEGQDRVDGDGVALDARNGVVFCSGALHMPAPWRGERYALVFFTQVGLGKVSWEDLVLLRSLGFRLCAG